MCSRTQSTPGSEQDWTLGLSMEAAGADAASLTERRKSQGHEACRCPGRGVRMCAEAGPW